MHQCSPPDQSLVCDFCRQGAVHLSPLLALRRPPALRRAGLRPGMRSKTPGKISGKTKCITPSAQPACSTKTMESQMPLNHESASATAGSGRPQPVLTSLHSSSRPGTIADNRPSSAGSSLVSCVYIALRCSHCGDLRQALAELPRSGSVACPQCGSDCTFIMLASGLTTRSLPFHECQRVKPARCGDTCVSDLHDSS